MRARKVNGWRFYAVPCGEIGIGALRRPKFFPDSCRLNSAWITRQEAARLIREHCR